jgi:crossover junction endodeoxyribonuclease RuvC
MIVGIDPGLTGALAVLTDDGGFFEVHDLPVMLRPMGGLVRQQMDGAALAELMRELEARLPADERGKPVVIVEDVGQIRPGRGVSSQASLVHGLGVIEGVLSTLGWSMLPVTPQVWKRRAGLKQSGALTDTQKKAASLSLARTLYPDASLDRVKDHGRADALLIARYGLIW